MLKIQDLLNIIDYNASSFHSKLCDELTKKQDFTYFDINDIYICEALRLYVLQKSLYVYFSSNEEDNENVICYSKIDIKEIPKIIKILNISNINSDTLYFYITSKQSDNTINLNTLANILLNKNTLEFEIYKNHERYNNFNTIDIKLSDNQIIYGDILLHYLGIIPIDNINVLCYKDIIQVNDSINMCIINEDKKTIISNNIKCEYDYFSILWPKLLNAKNLETIIYNPEFHAYVNNNKIININLFTKLLQNNLIPKTYAYINLFNKYTESIKLPLCIPNLSIINNTIKINNDEQIKIQSKEINIFLNSLQEESINIPKCSELPHEIYFSKPERNIYTNAIIKYHNNVVNYYISRYLDKNKFLDIGAGPLRQIQFYEKIGIKKLIAIEPSSASIETGLERFNNECKYIDLVMIQGFGEEDWNLPKYKQVLINKPYKSILFKFTIHYMLSNLDQLLLNLKNVSITGTKVLVTCLNGDILLSKLQDSTKYEIINSDSVLYGIYNYDNTGNNVDYKKVMVYFKGVYGVESGSIEYIVSINFLIKKFKEYGFKITISENFMQINIPKLINIRKDYNKAQRLISELHHILMFEKI